MKRHNNFAPKPNFKWSVFSVSVVLFFLSLVAMIGLHSSVLVKHYKEQLVVLVELKNDRSSAATDDLKAFLDKQKSILESSIIYVGKDEAYKQLQEKMGLEKSNLEMSNPLLDAFHFRLTADQVERGKLSALSSEIESFAAVEAVHYQDVIFDTLFRHLDVLVLSILGFAVLILPIALILIFGAIRLALYDQRFLIRNMELLGASWSFIRKPFLRRGIRLSLISSVGGLLPLVAIIGFLVYTFPNLLNYIQWPETTVVVVCIVAFSFLIYFVCNFASVTKYLRLGADY